MLALGCVLLLCLRRLSGRFSAPTTSAADVQKRLVGNWRLVKFENFDENGAARDAGYESGRIMYDAAGNMAAQLMRVNRKPLSQPSTEAERAAAYAGTSPTTASTRSTRRPR